MSAADPSPTADRPVWGLSHVVVGLVLSLVASTVFMAFAFVAGGYSTAEDMPLSVIALSQVPLWTGLLGVPLWLVRARGVGWAQDLGWAFRRSDALLGLAIGVGAQAVLVPLLYLPLRLLVAALDVSGPARALVASSLVFGAAHFQPLQFPALVMFGLIAGVLVQRDGRLGRAVWAHVGFNSWTVGVLLVV